MASNLNIQAEGTGVIEVEIVQEVPQLTLEPSQSPLAIDKTTKELFIAEEEQLQEAVSKIVESEITERVYERVVVQIDTKISTNINTAITNYDNNHKVVVNPQSKNYENY